jgi:hypothetical protein
VLGFVPQPNLQSVPMHFSVDKHTSLEKAINTLKEFGMKRFVRQIFCLTGKVEMKDGKVFSVIINPLYPFVSRIIIAFKALLKPYGISVSLDEI